MLRYAISDRLGLADTPHVCRDALLEQSRRLAAQQIDFFQLREKDLGAGELAALARELLPLPGAARLLINGRADVAVAVGAAGVHLTAAAGELTPSQIRQLYRRAGLPSPLVSVSCHTRAEVLEARDGAATHILFGPVFGKEVQGKAVARGLGISALEEACAAAGPLPVLALGGIREVDVAACLNAGAAGVAGIRLFR